VEPETVPEDEADVVFECVGRVETMKAAVEAARPG
jgi:threonine dehydrogenase-like Zn-dependent dehydrogenase